MSTSYDRQHVKLNQGQWAYVRETVLIGRQLGTSLYQLTPSLSKVRKLSCPKFMLPIKSFRLKCVNYLLQMHFITSAHAMSISLVFKWNMCVQLIHTEHQFFSLICCSVKTLKKTIKDKKC